MAGHGKRGKRGEEHAEHVDERWLLTYSDLITLLMALFMVLFSISSVNKSKFESLQHSLQDAFSGRILPGGKSIKDAGGTDNIVNPAPAAPVSSLQPYVGGNSQESSKSKAATAAAKAKEQAHFQALKTKLDSYAKAKGLAGKVTTRVTADGLAIRVLTDDLMFDSGSAVPKAQSLPLLREVADLLRTQVADHALMIQGNTDNQPIHSGLFADNWALSTARALSILHAFADHGLDAARMTPSGRGEHDPIASNDTAAGRTLNRRVEIIVPNSDAGASLSSLSGTTSTSSSSTASTAAGAGSGASASIPSIRPDLAPTRP